MADGVAADRFAIRRWDDGIAVFDRRSGATHGMSLATGRVFEVLAARPDAHDEELLRVVSGCLQEATDEACRSALHDTREQLLKAGLIES